MPKRFRSAREIGPAGTTLRASGPHGPQRIESDGLRWTDEAEAAFLNALGASCNVAYAMRIAGFSKHTIYSRRRNDPAFAERWRIALTQGFHRLEELLLQRAVETMEGYAPDPDTPMPAVSFRDAMALLDQHRATVRGDAVHGKSRRARVRTLDEVRASILVKLEAIEAKRLAEEAERAGSDGSADGVDGAGARAGGNGQGDAA